MNGYIYSQKSLFNKHYCCYQLLTNIQQINTADKAENTEKHDTAPGPQDKFLH